MEKAEISLRELKYGQSNLKEEAFRCIQTLHSLLDSPPGDLPDDLREEITNGLIKIFSNIRYKNIYLVWPLMLTFFSQHYTLNTMHNFVLFTSEEGKLFLNLVKCINTYLIRDGPNMGVQSLKIHDAVHKFLFRIWLETHDCGLKVV